jgi:phospholipase D1/2
MPVRCEAIHWATIILGAFLIGTIISLPITILILATALVFGPMNGIIYSFIGCIIA